MIGKGTSLDFIFSNLISGSYDGAEIKFNNSGDELLIPQGNRLTFFNVSRGESVTHYIESPSNINHCAISDDNKFILTSDRKNNVIISQNAQGGFSYLKKFKKNITAIAFAPKGIGFALALSNKIATYEYPDHVNSLKPFVLIKRYVGHFDAITRIEFSPDGTLFTTCSNDMTIRIYMTNPTDEFAPIVLTGHRGIPVFATFVEPDNFINDLSIEGENSQTPQKYRVTSLGQDGSLFDWSINPAEEYSVTLLARRRLDEEDFVNPKNHFQNITAGGFNGEMIVSGFPHGVFKTYAMSSLDSPVQSTNTVTFSTEKVTSVAISKKYAALTSAKLGELVVWDLIAGSVAQRTMSHFGGVSCFDYSPNGVVVATGGDDGRLKIWDTVSGSCLMTFSEHDAPITDVAFAQSGRTVISCSLDGTIKAYDVVTSRCFRTMNATPDSSSGESPNVEFTKIAVDSHCEFVAACAKGCLTIFLFAVGTGKLLEEIAGHEAPVCSVAFSPLGKLVSGSWDKTVRVWDFLETHTSIALDARDIVSDIAVSPDGNIVAISNASGKVLFYNPNNEEYIGEIAAASDARGGKLFDSEKSASNTTWFFDSISFSPDGSFIICGGRTKYICIYSVSSLVLMRKIQHTKNSEYSGVEGYLKKKDYHGSGKAQEILEAKLAQRRVLEAATREVKWCPTGRGIAAASCEGLLIFVSADEKVVDPIELEVEATPQKAQEALEKGEWVQAVVNGVKLGHSERNLLKNIVFSVPDEAIEFVASHLPARFAPDFLEFLGEAIKSSTDIELLIKWTKAVLRFQTREILKLQGTVSVGHLIQKALSSKVEQVTTTARANLDLMNFICSQPNPQ